MHPSRDVPETASFFLDKRDDALDFATNRVKDSGSGFALNNFDAAESYRCEESEVCVALRSRSEGNQYHLIFRVIPEVGIRHTHVASAANIHPSINGSSPDRDKESVLVSVGHLAQCIEDFVPSTVRLERPKQRVNLLRDVFALPFYGVFDVALSFPEREVGTSGVGFTGCNCHPVSGVIQSLSEVGESIAAISESPSGRGLFIRTLCTMRLGSFGSGSENPKYFVFCVNAMTSLLTSSMCFLALAILRRALSKGLDMDNDARSLWDVS